MPPSTPLNLDSLGAWLALLTRSSYLLFVAVLLAWFGRLAWFDRETDGAVSFNYHPLFMGLAFVVLMPEALLAYADLEERRGFGHAAAKKMHAWAHIAASVCILLGLIFVFANHSAKGIPALYSAHSWIGLTAAMCTFLQAIVGCVAYALPTLFGVGGESRARLLPAHRFAGAATLALGAAACVAGFVEKQSFTKCALDASDKRCAALSLVNVLVLLVASTATCALGTVYARWVGGGGAAAGATARIKGRIRPSGRTSDDIIEIFSRRACPPSLITSLLYLPLARVYPFYSSAARARRTARSDRPPRRASALASRPGRRCRASRHRRRRSFAGAASSDRRASRVSGRDETLHL
jgi:cytochrome b-561